jgi:hypothetical protein
VGWRGCEAWLGSTVRFVERLECHLVIYLDVYLVSEYTALYETYSNVLSANMFEHNKRPSLYRG